MNECTSVRGEWGEPCPDCGQVLPSRPGPLASWQATRAPVVAFGRVSDRRWTPEAYDNRMAAYRQRQRQVTDRQREVLRIVEKHGGNRSAAARELGVSGPTVVVTLKRLRALGVEVPA